MEKSAVSDIFIHVEYIRVPLFEDTIIDKSVSKSVYRSYVISVLVEIISRQNALLWFQTWPGSNSIKIR